MQSTRLVLGTSVLALGTNLVATQVRTVRHHSPWQDDPYNAVLCLALTLLPVLIALLASRAAALRRLGRPDRADAALQQARTGLAACVVLDVTLGFQWVAVLGGAHRSEWSPATTALIGVLATVTAGAAVGTVAVVRAGAVRRLGRPFTSDWLGDVAAAVESLPGLRRTRITMLANGIQRHAVAVFAGLSLLGALLVVTPMVVGEHWTDPRLIAWAVAVEAVTNFCACLIVNAIAGIVARPRAHPRLERAVAASGVAAALAVAFHDPLWTLLAGRPASGVGALTALTAGAAALAAAIAWTIRTS